MGRRGKAWHCRPSWPDQDQLAARAGAFDGVVLTFVRPPSALRETCTSAWCGRCARGLADSEASRPSNYATLR
jgi:hypothetical protein